LGMRLETMTTILNILRVVTSLFPIQSIKHLNTVANKSVLYMLVV
jgi:hypothetical protein